MLGRCWADDGQFLGRCWADAGQSLGRCWADPGHMLSRCLAGLGQMLGRSWADPGQTLDRCWAELAHLGLILGRFLVDLVRYWPNMFNLGALCSLPRQVFAFLLILGGLRGQEAFQRVPGGGCYILTEFGLKWRHLDLIHTIFHDFCPVFRY